MKIILDTDGTMTNFNEFIMDEAVPFFKKKYSMEIVNDSALEVQDIFDMDNFFATRYNCSKEEAKKYTKEALDDFWVNPRYLKYALFSKFRAGLSKYIKKAIKDGHDIEVHTSRDKTTRNDLLGKAVRELTRLQYSLNGIHIEKNKFHFYENDTDKVNGIIAAKPTVVFDDKPSVIEKLTEKGVKCICVDGVHNRDIENTKDIIKNTGENSESIHESVSNIVGKNNTKYYEEAAKTDKFFNKVASCKNLLLDYFDPIILNEENLIDSDDDAIIYAPNHRSTLDPLVINGVIGKHIHWAALKRFFDGEDSIFNNSKNPALCELTSYIFKNLGFFPIERKKDNPEANNLTSILDMVGNLKINQKVGIFPEGTTLKDDKIEQGIDFGTFSDSFITMAEKTNAIIQPITIYWFHDENHKKRPVINFGKPIRMNKLSGMTKKEREKEKKRVYNEYINIQHRLLGENKNTAYEFMNNQSKRALNIQKKIL